MNISITDYFIPEKNQADQELYKRHKFFVVSVITTLLLSVFYVSFFYFVEFTPGVYIVGGYVISHFIFLYLSHIGVSLYIIGNLFALMTYLGFGYGSAMSGGVSSAIIAWFLSTKVSSFWYADRKSGYFWSALTIITVTVFLFLEVYGVEFKLHYNTKYRPYFSGTMHIGVLIYYVIVLKVYEDWKEQSILTLKNTVTEKNKLMQAITHDLRNPLTILSLELKKLYNIDGIDELKSELGVLQKQTTKLVDITNELVNPLENSNSNLVLIRHFIKNYVLDNFAEQATLKNINFKFKFHLSSKSHSINEIKMERVLQNIISNAIKYSNTNSTIDITTTKTVTSLIIKIQDEGLGLSSEEVQKIFEPYSHIDNQPTAGESTIGIGLSITKELVNELGGSIEVFSEGKNKGAMFKLTFPIS